MKSARNKIYCLIFTGTSLSDAACDALFQAACDCIIDEKHEKKIYNDDVEGIVYTDFDFGAMGSIRGVVFKGEIETPQGSTKVKYIVQRHDLEEVRKHHMNWDRYSLDEFLETIKDRKHEMN
jgi:hypothetical protein